MRVVCDRSTSVCAVAASQTHCTICGLPVSKDEYSAHVDDCKRHNPEMARAAAKGKGKAAPLTSVVPLHVKKRIESGGAATGPPVRWF